VAHDFNNLLTVILGNLDLLQGTLEDPVMSRMVKSAMDASSRAAELTQRLLAFSRKQALEPRPTDVNDLVAGMADLMQRSLGEPIKIEIAGGDDLWQCEIDPAQLENAILNLAINARDAMPRGGKLTIGTANVTLGEGDAAAQDDFPPGDYVMISVADDGVGMPRNVVERAFEPFFTTKDVGEGSGLGLSMVYGFIKQSGGHVAIDTKPDEGTTVKLYLQRSHHRRQAAEPGPEAVEPLSRGEKVLVVEDDAEVRALIVESLAGLGYAIVEAADGRQAIQVLKATPAIDLLFTDVVLPGGMSGADVAAEATRRNAGIKVLYVSGYTDNVLARRGQLDPGAQFINKPFRRSELAQKVRAALDGAAA
jgi:CheY-like chemotaxis protein